MKDNKIKLYSVVNKDLITELLQKYLEGKLSRDERNKFFDVLSDEGNMTLLRDIMFNQISGFSEIPEKNIDFDRQFRNIISRIDRYDAVENEMRKVDMRVKARKILRFSSLIAAVFAVAFLLGRFLPEKEKIGIPETAIAMSFTEISAPYGSRSEINLPDGTEVVLNAGSTLRYQNDFNVTNRDLDLTGEAYFRVAKNEQIPLIVNAGSINIKAVGTTFNIKAYDEEGTVETTLIEGKVEITRNGEEGNVGQFVGLEPNQKAIFIKDEDSFILEKIKNSGSAIEPVNNISEDILISPKVNVSHVVAWTEGKLILRAENLGDLSVDLERKYDVKFVFADEEIKKYRFTGILLDETLEQVLNVIRLTAPINYVLDGKTVHLSSDPGQLNDYSKHINQKK